VDSTEIRSVDRKFLDMGAKVKVSNPSHRGVLGRRGSDDTTFAINILGGVFDIQAGSDVEVRVVDSRPEDRHLLLHVKAGTIKSKFLCGHDERDWFVAAVPGSGVTSVQGAKAALKPAEVHQAETRGKIRSKKIDRRRNRARTRQGEWFFVPVPDLEIDRLKILYREPLRRATRRGFLGKPHFAEECYRMGGETVYVSHRNPAGLTEAGYRRLPDIERARHRWSIMRRNPQVYVRGRITHSDHATIVLRGWHKVIMNTEQGAIGSERVTFLD
jgi:hypothetical protein